MVHIYVLFLLLLVVVKSLFEYGMSNFAFPILLIASPIVLYVLFFNEKRFAINILFLILSGFLIQNYIENKIQTNTLEYNSGFIFENKEKITTTGKISRFPSYRFSNNQYIVSIDKTNILLYTNPYQKYDYLDEIQFTASLQNVLEQDVKWHNYYKKLNVHYVVWSADILDVQKTNQQTFKENFLYRIFEFKTKIRELTLENFSSHASALILGMILGEKEELSKEEKEIFNKANLSHIMVVSGYNISLVISFAFILAKSFHRYVKTIFAIILILFFVFIVGFDPSVVRSALMGSVLIIGKIIHRESSGVHTLFLVATLMILHNPIIIFDVGFHLSFIATYSLCIIPNFKKIPEYIFVIIWVYLFITPYIIFLAGSTSFVGLLTNALVLFCIPFFMLISIASLILLFSKIIIFMDILLLEFLSRYIFFIASIAKFAPRFEISINGVTVFSIYLIILSSLTFIFNRYETLEFIEKFYQKNQTQDSN